GGMLERIDAETGRRFWKPQDATLTSVRDFAFSADGKTIGAVSGTSSVVEEYDAATGKKLHTWKTDGKSSWVGLAFHPDHGRFVTLSNDRTTTALWDYADGHVAS